METILSLLGIGGIIFSAVVIAAARESKEGTNPFEERSWSFCAWCSDWHSSDGIRQKEKPENAPDMISHGICRQCIESEQAKSQEAKMNLQVERSA